MLSDIDTHDGVFDTWGGVVVVVLCNRLLCFIGLNVDFTGVVSTVGGGGVLKNKTKKRWWLWRGMIYLWVYMIC